jgi:hypothetical protein
MQQYDVTMNEQQMQLIQKALDQLLQQQQVDQTLSDDDFEELQLLSGIVFDTPAYEQAEPGITHGWCY